MKKLLCAVLAVILLLSCGAFALTKNEIYTAAVDSFTEYLNDNDSVSLDTLYTNFASLGTYEWSMQFMLYTDILRSVQNGSYARVSTYLTVLRSNEDFCAFLEEQSKKSKVGSVDELEAYVNANKALGQGDSAAALQYFMSCPNFLDSTARILSIESSFLQEKYEKAGALFEEGKYEEAAALFRELDSYEDSAALLETCEFLIAVLAIPEATEEEAAEEIIPEETKTETAETVEPVDDTEYVSGDYKYKKLNNGKIEITKYTGNAAQLSVPGEIDGFEVYGIGDYAFYWNKSLTEIFLPVGLESIGDYAFYLSSSLTKIFLPDGLKSIGDCAFYSCSLTEITLPDSITDMGANPFRNCDLNKIIVSKDHPYLTVLDGVLYDKVNKRLICYPLTLTASSYAVPDGILSIDDYAFHLGSLTEISLPDSITDMGANPFTYCYNLNNIIVSKDHPYLTVLDGVLYDKVNKRLICYPLTLKATSYTVPNGTLSVGDYAFYDYRSLKEIFLPDGLESIGDKAFYFCSSLTKIHIPDSVTEIGVNPFAICSNSLSVTISVENSRYAVVDGVLFDKLDKNLICYPSGLTEATYTVPEGILSIGESAFDTGHSLKELILPKGVKSVGRYAFWNSESMTVTMPAEITSIGERIFSRSGNRLMVYTGSYAAQYAKENGIPYEYIDALDWLNN